MPRARRRPKSVRKSRNTNLVAQERHYARAPHSFVFARPNVGSLVRHLSADLRRVFEPFTASQLQVTKKNVLKDFINIAGPLNVSHIVYLTHPRTEKMLIKRKRHSENLHKKRKVENGVVVKEEEEEEEHDEGDNTATVGGGGVYMHLIRTPNGPSLTFRVSEYSLTRDVFTLVRKVFDARQFTKPPLLAMTGFGSSSTTTATTKQLPQPHLRLLVDMFQNMLPSLNLQKLKLSSVRRVLLLSREVDSEGGEVIYVRHFNIRIENRSISKALRRLGVGGGPLRKQRAGAGGLGPQGTGKSSGVPSLGKYASIDDYLTKASMLTDSGMSDMEDLVEVELPGGGGSTPPAAVAPTTSSSSKKLTKEALEAAKAAHGFTHLTGCRKAALKLTEIGPRLTLQLIKIEEGVNSGSVLYHSWYTKSPAEVSQQEESRRAKAAAKARLRQIQEQRRLANESTRATHRAACLHGMRKTATETDEKVDSDALVVDDAEDVEPRDPDMHNLSSEEEVEFADKKTEVKKECPPSSGGDGFAKRNKKKRKKAKNAIGIARKHPAYNYLTQKSEMRKLAKQNQTTKQAFKKRR